LPAWTERGIVFSKKINIPDTVLIGGIVFPGTAIVPSHLSAQLETQDHHEVNSLIVNMRVEATKNEVFGL
jgi:hypothetical protein